MDKALIVKEKWLNLILDGDESGPKLWEIRGSGTWIRGRVGLIQSGSASASWMVTLRAPS